MRRNDIKIISLELIEKNTAILIAQELKERLEEIYDDTLLNVYIHDFDTDPSMARVCNYGVYTTIFGTLKSQLDATLNRIKRNSLKHTDRKEVHILLPNILSFIYENIEYNVGCCALCDHSTADIERMRHKGLYGLSCNNTQLLDVFDNCGYKNYDFDLIIRFTSSQEPCNLCVTKVPCIENKYSLSECVSKYLLRVECPDKYLNGREIHVQFDPCFADKKCHCICHSCDTEPMDMISKIIKEIGVYVG